jgi:lysophospholipase L1-like esterase
MPDHERVRNQEGNGEGNVFRLATAAKLRAHRMNSTPPAIPVLPAPLAYKLPNLGGSLEHGKLTRIVALGSSSTAGEGNIAPYPYRLEVSLRNSYSKRDGRPYHMIDVINRGIGGEEAPKEQDRLKEDVLKEDPCLVIWQIGTNSVWQSAADDPPPFEKTIEALQAGIQQLKDAGTIDIILMDLQYTPALLTPATLAATNKMVLAIADVAQVMQVNLFQRFKLMKGWHDLASIPLDQMVDPGDDSRLHQSEWATQKVSEKLHDVISNVVNRDAAEYLR